MSSSSTYDPRQHIHQQLNTLYEAELAAARSFDVENMNYEQLTELCDRMGTVKVGVPKETFDRIPTRTLYLPSSTSPSRHRQQQQQQHQQQNKIGQSRQQELSDRLRLIKKDPPVDGSAAIRAQRMSISVGQRSSTTNLPPQHHEVQQQHQQHNPLLSQACCICVSDLLDTSTGEKCVKVKTLPCKHTFHASCIKQWLTSHKTCPVCKADVARQAASVGALFCQLMSK